MSAPKQKSVRPLNFNGTVAEALAKGLVRHGVNLVFGQSLPSALHLAAKSHGIRQAWYRTENAGGAMADAFARLSHRVGVVTAQNGPAATLLVPPLAEALKASVPVVALVQEVALTQTDKNAFQEFDHMALFGACTKWVRRLDQASRADDYLDMAFRAAVSGRPGPVALLLPADLLLAPYQPGATPRHQSLGSFPLERTMPDRAHLDEAAELLASAERPLIIAGGGVHLSGASQELATLQEAASLPVATTVMGKGSVDENHPLSLGVVGYFMGTGGSGKFQRKLVEQADLVLLVGNRTNQNGTDSWSLYPSGARYIHIDADPMEIGRNYEALPLLGDAKLILSELTALLKSRDLAGRRAARPALEKKIAQGKARHQQEAKGLLRSKRKPVRPERIMYELNRRLTPETVVVADASYSSIWVANYLTSLAPGMRFITPRGLAGLGWGLPMAMGAKLARPQSPVVCLAGDGGFGHSWSELEAAARMGLDLTIMVLNNRILGYQKHAENVKFGDHTDAVYMSDVDHAAVAEACGCRGIRVRDPEKLPEALDLAMSEPGPVLVDILSDPTAYPPITSFEGKLAM
ncbi:MAG: acetolactate synthase catalytic subunit [Proteobacteria bacterium]|nr:acetolactate synthase catalytic subunit [Pseudomonadota bacterium]MBU4381671.1 acetolactate synthase catalytic subunit [Pseudomonadota bacterium]MCG2766658.1 acetolactate synthase catalytic subunit [Desulfarculaceae bacterium]